MSYSNFHTHCGFCDGEMDPEAYIREALRRGFNAVGFSSHAPVPFENEWTMQEGRLEEYCDTINLLKNKYQDKIKVYLGLEIDYLPGVMGPASARFEKLKLDYTIGSVHFVYDPKTRRYLGIDGSEAEYAQILENVFHGSIQAFVTGYYKLIREMLFNHRPSIIGHLDIIKKNNKDGKYFAESENWYKAEVRTTLEQIAASGSILEVNTGGLARKYTTDLYPSTWILSLCHELNIPIVINSDAHSPKNVDAFFDEASAALLAAGYTHQTVLHDKMWLPVGLKRS